MQTHTRVFHETKNRPRIHYSAGILASLVAEVVFIGMVIGVSAIRGKDLWMVTKVPGSFLLGPAATQPPGFVASTVAVGLLMHLLLSVLVGVIYTWALPRLRVSPIVGGLITGGILYALGFWILPLLFYPWLSPFWLPPLDRLLQAVAHTVYGLAFGLIYARLPHSAAG